MGLYMVFFQCLPSLGVIISGFVITALGWRWHFWVTSIYAGIIVLSVFFFFPETQYYRAPMAPEFAYANAAESPAEKEPTAQEVQESNTSPTPPKKSFFNELNPYSGINPGIEKDTNFFTLFIRPWPLTVYPAVVYSFLVFSVNVACGVGTNSTVASVFQNPPYNMSPGIQSLINIPAIIGAAAGSYWGGALTDRFVEWRARKNNGVFEPETRLLALVLPLFIVPAGVLMYGFGIAHQTSWAVPWIGNGLICFGLGSLPTITLSYVVDSYFPLAPELMLLIVGLKNVFAFGFSYAIVPWIEASGYIGIYSTLAGIQFGTILLGVPLWYWGKQIRHATAKWKLIMW